MENNLDELLLKVRACTHCAEHLPLGPNPILRAAANSKVLIVGQAPGTKVHKTGVPWNDPSGDRLRQWLGVSRETFYDTGLFAIVPMGFCYPGKGKSGDLPPRKECAELWLDRILQQMTRVKLTLVIGQYAQAHYLGKRRKSTLTETVKAWKEYQPRYIPLPHPSPRNQMWLKRNPWFDKEVVPMLQQSIAAFL